MVVVGTPKDVLSISISISIRISLIIIIIIIIIIHEIAFGSLALTAPVLNPSPGFGSISISISIRISIIIIIIIIVDDKTVPYVIVAVSTGGAFPNSESKGVAFLVVLAYGLCDKSDNER
jgi:hypothetical protein